MRTRLTWLVIGAAMAVFATQAWARTLSTNTATSRAKSYAVEAMGGTIKRTVVFIDHPSVYPVRCVRGLASGDPPDPSGRPFVAGTSDHRFDCAARVTRDGRWNSPTYSTVSPPQAESKTVRVVVTMRHHRNIFGQASYPVSVRRADCSVNRCVDP